MSLAGRSALMFPVGWRLWFPFPSRCFLYRAGFCSLFDLFLFAFGLLLTVCARPGGQTFCLRHIPEGTYRGSFFGDGSSRYAHQNTPNNHMTLFSIMSSDNCFSLYPSRYFDSLVRAFPAVRANLIPSFCFCWRRERTIMSCTHAPV